MVGDWTTHQAGPLSGGNTVVEGMTCMAIGNFDGVHLGHQWVVERMLATSERIGAFPGVLSFEPHPREFFAKRAKRHELIPSKIYSVGQKVEALNALGVENVVIQPFNFRVAEVMPEDFVEAHLVRRLRVRAVVVGQDFRFGRDRKGDVGLLRAMGQHLGFEVDCPDGFYNLRGTRVSSTLLRELIAAGQFDEVNRLLGRSYELSGSIIRSSNVSKSGHMLSIDVRLENRLHGLRDIPLGMISVRSRAAFAGTIMSAFVTGPGRNMRLELGGYVGPPPGALLESPVTLEFGSNTISASGNQERVGQIALSR